MDADTLAKIRYLDEQIAAAQLSQQELEMVNQYRQRELTATQELITNCGMRPPEPEAAGAWDRQYHNAKESLKLQMEQERLQTPGLQNAWETWALREERKEARRVLMGPAVHPSSMPMAVPAGLVPPQQASMAAQPQQQPPPQQQQQVMQQLPPNLMPPAQQQQLHQQQQQQLHQQMTAVSAAASAPQWALPPQPVAEWQPAAPQEGDQHVEVMSLEMNSAPAYDVNAYAQQQQQQQVQQQHQQPQPVPQGSKECRKCRTVKPFTEFYRSKANTDGYDGRCKACDAIQCIERRKKKARIDTPTVSEKTCHKCHTLKPAGDFYRNRTNKDGLYNNCKECFANNSHRRQQQLPPMEQRMATSKKCRRCNEEKPATEFYKNRLMLDGLYSHCKHCYQTSAASRAATRQPVDTKTCKKCDLAKPSSEFYKSKMTSDGLQSYCKHCYKITAAQTRVKKLVEEQESAAAAGALATHPQGMYAAAAEGAELHMPQNLQSGGAADAAAAVGVPLSTEEAGGEVADSQARLNSLLAASDPAQLQQQVDVAQQQQAQQQQQQQQQQPPEQLPQQDELQPQKLMFEAPPQEVQQQ